MPALPCRRGRHRAPTKQKKAGAVLRVVGHCLQEATSSPPDVEGDAASLSAETNAQASTSSSSLSIYAAGIGRSNSGSFSASGSGGGAAPSSPAGTRAGSASHHAAAGTSKGAAAGSRCSTAAAAAAATSAGSTEAGPDQLGQVNTTTVSKQYWPQLVSAYPKVTVDTLQAAAVTAAGCSVCANVPAAAAASAGGSGSSASAAAVGGGLGNSGGSSSAPPGSVTAAARDVVALVTSPTLEVSCAAATVNGLSYSLCECLKLLFKQTVQDLVVMLCSAAADVNAWCCRRCWCCPSFLLNTVLPACAPVLPA